MKDFKRYLIETLIQLTILFGIYKLPSNFLDNKSFCLNNDYTHNNNLNKINNNPLVISEPSQFRFHFDDLCATYPHCTFKQIDSYVNEFRKFKAKTTTTTTLAKEDFIQYSKGSELNLIPTEYYLYPVQVQSYNNRADTSLLQVRDTNVNDFINDANLNKVCV